MWPKSEAMVLICRLHSSISSQQSTFPDAVNIIAGYVNHADLKVGQTTHWGACSWHHQDCQTWPDGASQQLQDCFDRTSWEVFDQVLHVGVDKDVLVLCDSLCSV